MKALKSLIPALKPGAKILIHDHGLADPGEGRLADENYERSVTPTVVILELNMSSISSLFMKILMIINFSTFTYLKFYFLGCLFFD